MVKRTAAKATRSLLYRHHLQQPFPDQTGISHRELTEPAWRSAAATVPGPPSVNGMLKCRLLRARGEYAWWRPRAHLLACGSGQLGQAVQGGQAQWEGGAEEHRDLRPRHRAHAPRYCPCPRRRTSGGSESSLNLSFGSPQYPLVVTSTRPLVRAAKALVNLLIGPDARQPPRARPPGREKPPGRSSSRRLERRGQR